ncbi:acyltransferase family protein [Jiangella aurantiaca]|nr:acyltransferase family protein [Jiangella aurantiaca]
MYPGPVPPPPPPPARASTNGRLESQAAGGREPAFRGDIQGLRAVAVLLVVAYHAGVPFLPGGFVGVDVFFVISGFLITGVIDREIGRTGTINLARFWARRVRRILPAAAVVLAAVAVMTLLVLPVTRWPSIAWDLVTSSLYVVNWRFADQSTNYMAYEDAASPLQHYWSLAVEEQFYLIWPLMMLAVLWLQRRYRLPLTKAMLFGVAAIGVPSLVWSVYATWTGPAAAYFVSTTRLWELAVGAALAVVAHRLVRLPAAVAHSIGVAGMAAIVVAACTFDETTRFPGIAALLPTAGAAAVLAAGVSRRRTIAGAVLDTPVLRDIGAMSYSLYLWHWPLLVGATAQWGGADGELSVAMGLLVVGFSAVPAWLTYRTVEAPLHRSVQLVRFPRRAAAVGAVCTAIGLSAAMMVSIAAPVSNARAGGQDILGAVALDRDPAEYDLPDAVDVIVPDVLDAPADVATLDGERRCISGVEGTELESCTYGPDEGDVTVAIVGDSKMHQWLPALRRIADERGWRIITYLKNACPLVRVPIEYDGEPNRDCAEYNRDRYEAIVDDESIDYVITSQAQSHALLDRDDTTDQELTAMADDLRRTWSELEDAGHDVIVMIDNPSPPFDVVECVAENRDQLGECAFDKEAAMGQGGRPAQTAALDRIDGVGSVDLANYVCPGDQCPPVIGNVLVYRRGSHISATYADSLTTAIDEGVADAL